MYFPISGPSVISSGVLIFRMFVYVAISSREIPVSLEVTYLMAVMKDIGLNNPEIQSDFGTSISSE